VWLSQPALQDMDMTAPEANTRRLDALIWAIVAATAAFVLVVAPATGFTIDWSSFRVPALVVAAGLAGQIFYERRRHDPRLAGALGCCAQIIAFAAVGAPLSYLAAAVAAPLQDHAFDAADRILGFDWVAMAASVNAHAPVRAILQLIYVSLMPQAVIAILALALSGRLRSIRVFMLSFVFAALLTIAISALIPAEGAWLYDGLKASVAVQLPDSHTSWPTFLGLRDGSVRDLVGLGAEGIITFPSLHAALAIILLATFWPLAALRWPGVIINVLMLVATPFHGSHYFVDVLAGVVIAALALVAARACAGREQPRGAETIPIALGAALRKTN
jgi:hypothetical protein